MQHPAGGLLCCGNPEHGAQAIAWHERSTSHPDKSQQALRLSATQCCDRQPGHDCCVGQAVGQGIGVRRWPFGRNARHYAATRASPASNLASASGSMRYRPATFRPMPYRWHHWMTVEDVTSAFCAATDTEIHAFGK